MIDFTKNRKNILLVGGGILLLLALAIVLLLATKGCSEERAPVDNPFESTTSIDSTGDTEGENTPTESESDQEGNESVPVNPVETSGGEDEMPPGVTDLKVLKKDLTSDKSTNILILGEDQLNGLMDTIGIISIDKDTEKVKIIMIPRDAYIQYNERVLGFMRNYGKFDVPGAFKINYAYYLGWYIHDRGWELDFKGKFDKISFGVSFLTQVIEEKFDLTIHDFIRVDTEGFAEAVELFGGVDIYIPYDMDYEDPGQDLHIHLEKGMKRLDGKQAEGFVRFRTGYDDEGNELQYGDIERKKNQIAFLKAFIEQHGTLANIDKIPGFLGILGKRVWSSIGVGDVLFKYTTLAASVVNNKYEIESLTISGRQWAYKGILYVVIE